MEDWQLARKGRRPDTLAASRPTTSTSRQILGRKFMQTLNDQVHRELSTLAQQRGITVQGLIRAVIVPEWVNSRENKTSIFSNPHPVAVENLPEQTTRTVQVEHANTRAQPLGRR
ncbi:MAG TPA: hypothetical protein VIH34_03565 [Candidatus Bathyarchaeia archaeon]